MSAALFCVTMGVHAVGATCALCVPGAFDRTRAIERVGFIMPALTDRGLQALQHYAALLSCTEARDLTPSTLAAEQRAREKPEAVRFDPPRCEWCKAAEGEIHAFDCRVRAVRQVLPGETLADACRREVAAERDGVAVALEPGERVIGWK